MRRKADAASAIARRWFFITLGLALVLMVVGVAVEFSLSNAIVGPVRQLTAATTKMAAGDLDAAVPVHSTDEIGTLAVGFNRMAERIRELRRSDLGKLLIAQQTTEAAIDSLYDPVIVTDSDGLVTRINPAAERLFGARADTSASRSSRSRATRASRRRSTDVLRSRRAGGLGRCRGRAAVGRRRGAARVSRPLDADAGRRPPAASAPSRCSRTSRTSAKSAGSSPSSSPPRRTSCGRR